VIAQGRFKMKNFFRLAGIIALAVVIGFSMAACSGDDDGGGGGGGGSNPFVGTWTGTMGGDYMKLVCKDKTWTTAGSDFGTHSGDYTRSGNTATFYVAAYGAVGTATVSGTTMTGNINGDGFTVTKK
jgi:hypothetical protein